MIRGALLELREHDSTTWTNINDAARDAAHTPDVGVWHPVNPGDMLEGEFIALLTRRGVHGSFKAAVVRRADAVVTVTGTRLIDQLTAARPRSGTRVRIRFDGAAAIPETKITVNNFTVWVAHA